MEILNRKLSTVLKLAETVESINESEIYRDLSFLHITIDNRQVFLEEILPNLLECCKKGFLRKDKVYVSFLSNSYTEMMHIITKYEAKTIEVDLSIPTTIFDFCFYKSRHWFLQVLEKIPDNVFNNDVYDNMKTIALLYKTAEDFNDLEAIESLLQEMKKPLSPLIQAYSKEVENLIKIIKFIKLNNTIVNNKDIYTLRCQNRCILDVLSQYLDLRSKTSYEDVKNLLENSSCHQSEMDKLNMFLIIKNALDLLLYVQQSSIINTDTIDCFIEDAKHFLTSIVDTTLITEAFENVYSLLFIKNSQLYDPYVGDGDGIFFCKNELLLKTLIQFIHGLKDEIIEKKLLKTDSRDYSRFNKICSLVADVIWRMEIVTACIKNKTQNNEVLFYILSNAEGLVHLCLNNNEYEKANQVVHIFQLQNTITENIIKNTIEHEKIKELFCGEQDGEQLKQRTETAKVLNKIGQLPPILEKESHEDLCTRFPILKQYKNLNFITFFDLFITIPSFYEDTNKMLDILKQKDAGNSYITTLLDNISLILPLIENKSVPSLLRNTQYLVDLNEYNKSTAFLNSLRRQLDEFNLGKSLKKQDIALTLQDNSINFAKQHNYSVDELFPKYISRILSYLKTYLKIYNMQFSTEHKMTPEDDNIFHLLATNHAELVRNLIDECKMNPVDLELHYRKVKMDLTLNIAKNYFPNIEINADAQNRSSHIIDIKFKTPTENAISYVSSRNWLLGYILGEMHTIFRTKIPKYDRRVNILNNLFETQEIQNLKPVFNNNKILAAICYSNSSKNVYQYCLDFIAKKLRININSVFINKESIAEAEQKQTDAKEVVFQNADCDFDWRKCFWILNSIPVDSYYCDNSLHELKDDILCKLIFEDKLKFHYVKFIHNDDLRLKIIFKEMKKWPVDFCIEVISENLSNQKLNENQRKVLINWYAILQFYYKCTRILYDDNWFETHCLCLENSAFVIRKITDAKKIHILLEYIKVYNPSEKQLKKIDAECIEKFFNDNVKLELMESLLGKLPIDHLEAQLNILITRIRNLHQLEFIAKHLSRLTSDISHINYLNTVQVSILILKHLFKPEQEQLFALIYDPMAILEVLIMNTRLDKFGEILKSLKPTLDEEHLDEIISHPKIDNLLEKYAKKSLDLRIIPQNKLRKQNDFKLLQSFETVTEKVSFVPPDVVPKREDWVPDADILECMCCKTSVFSMFNRRHHCRRCGRVICFSCSSRKVQVEGYGNIPVRICSDCNGFYHSDGMSSSMSDTSSRSNFGLWTLGTNPDDNEIVREEFSYEHAPSISLCLAILNHHSQGQECSRFLIEQCRNMLKMIKPIYNEVTQQIDYKFVIRMIKSLAVAAKLHSNRVDDYKGHQMAEKILRQANLYLFFVERGQINLLANMGSEFIDGPMLRNLKDKLVKNEEWSLSYDNTAVYAERAKSYLQAGKLMEAREKFRQCFDSIQISANDSKESSSIQNTTQIAKNGPKETSSPQNSEQIAKNDSQEAHCSTQDRTQIAKDDSIEAHCSTQIQDSTQMIKDGSKEAHCSTEILDNTPIAKNDSQEAHCSTQIANNDSEEAHCSTQIQDRTQIAKDDSIEAHCSTQIQDSTQITKDDSIEAHCSTQIQDSIQITQDDSKEVHCSTKIQDNTQITKNVSQEAQNSTQIDKNDSKEDNCSTKSEEVEEKNTSITTTDNRPKRDSPLLIEIIKILESYKTRHFSARATSTNEELTENDLKDNSPIFIQNRLKNLDNIANGKLATKEKTNRIFDNFFDNLKPNSEKNADTLKKIIHEECIFYLEKYGTDLSVLRFHVRNFDFQSCLKYVLEKNVTTNDFCELYFDCLKQGLVDGLLENMKKIDDYLNTWKEYILFICRQLESKKLTNSLYRMQIFVNDYVRCAISCLNFYTEDVKCYRQLKDRTKYLIKAERHLLQALEEKEWLEVMPTHNALTSQKDFELKPLGNTQLVLVLSKSQLEHYLQMFCVQREVVEVLATQEEKNPQLINFARDIVSYNMTDKSPPHSLELPPVVYDTTVGKIQVVMCLLLGADKVQDVFAMAKNVIDTTGLNAVKVFQQAAGIFVAKGRYTSVVQMVGCIQRSMDSFKLMMESCDEILMNACRSCIKHNVDIKEFVNLANLIKEPNLRMTAYVEADQLKMAFTFALRHKKHKLLQRLQRIALSKENMAIAHLCESILKARGQDMEYEQMVDDAIKDYQKILDVKEYAGYEVKPKESPSKKTKSK